MPNIHVVAKKPDAERRAMPLNAAPLAHPWARRDPKPKKIPPKRANARRRVELILGPLSMVNFKRRAKSAEINPPSIMPITS